LKLEPRNSGIGCRIQHLGFAALSTCVFLGGAIFEPAYGQAVAPETQTVRSYSGQFIVGRSRAPQAVGTANLAADPKLMPLDLSLLAVSAERIKQSLWRELGVTTPWRSKIFLTVYSAGSAEDRLTLNADRFEDGWQYQLELPNPVQRERYARAMVRVVLLELANRNAAERSAELPAWLVEGFSQQLLASNPEELILSAPGPARLASTYLNGRRENPLARAHAVLSAQTPLTFTQLSWPTAEQLDGAGGVLYRCSAQLFVNELLNLDGGRACLRTLLQEMPRYYNWQVAFLHAFEAWFQRPVDVEKWWTLRACQFTGRDLTQNWRAEDSWQKLDEILRSGVEVRTGANELPTRSEATLQTIIREWETDLQTQALQAKLQELAFFRMRVAPEFAVLVADYSQTLETFLRERDHPGLVLPFRRQAVKRALVEDTVRELNSLDTRRLASKPAVKLSVPPPEPARPESMPR
jgi:hypothetical protein